MKIALLDLNHTTCGRHSNTAPLGIGLMATYLKKKVDPNLDIQLFKEADKALNFFKSWVPDILGITQYCWNSELNLYVARLIKKINSNCIVIVGGPNLELTKEGKTNFLKHHDYVDIGVSYDGEIPLAEVVKRLLLGESITEIAKNPPAGTYSINPNNGNLVEPEEKPPRLDSLDVFGAVYTTRVFDKFLDDGYHPYLQTHRGCPFKCAYCHTSNSYSTHMLFLSPQLFKKEMEYLGKRFKGRHDVILYLANTNMGLFPQDFEIAKVIQETQKKYN